MPQVLVYLLNGRKLIAADSNGLSDPYVKLRVGSSSWRKSKIIQKTLNPDWNETFVLPVGDPQKDCLEIRVFDHDILVDDALGKAVVTLVNLRQGEERELTVTLDGVKSGEISIVLTALDFGEKKAEESTVYSKPRSEHPPLPLPASGIATSLKLPSPAEQLQSPPSHAPQVPSPSPLPPPQAAYPYPYPAPPSPHHPYPYYGAPPSPHHPYYAPPPYGYAPPPLVPPSQPPSALGDMDQVKQAPITDMYEFGKQLGKGSFAIVFEGMRKSDQQLVAIKCIEKVRVAGTNEKLLRREVLNLLPLEHPNIMKLHEIYEDQQKFYLVLEHIRGKELFDKIIALGHYSEQDASHIMGQVLSAIAYLHSKGIAHRDLKPENLMSIGSGADEKIKLADFGLSKNFSEEEMSTSCGSPLYVAPEVLTGQRYTKAVDMWSLGVILYIVLVGYPPFNGQNAVVLYRQILHNEWGFGPAWSVISNDAKDLVSKMMCYDASKRISAVDALEHPWIKQKAGLSSTPLTTQSELKKTIQFKQN